MSDHLDDVVTQALVDRLSGVSPGPGDVESARRSGARIRARRRVAVLVTALAVIGTGLTLTLARNRDAPEPVTPATGQWSRVADSPLPPRWSPAAVWTGDEVIVVGGGIGPPCPPGADCIEPDVMGSDAAAYDPDTDSWRRLADAPGPIGYWYRPVWTGDRVVLYGSDGRTDEWLVYDPATDTWSTAPPPPGPTLDQGALTSFDGRVASLSTSGRVQLLDPVAETWSALPRNDLEPRLDAENVVATDQGVFVTGPASTLPDDGDTPRFVTVDRWDGRGWTRLGVTGQVGSSWDWTGARLVNLDPQIATGLDGDPPYGGRFDPATRTWSPLPNAPDVERESLGNGWGANAAEGPLIAGWRSVYDDRTGTWTRLGKPAGTDIDSLQTGVWADGVLLLFGGLDEAVGYQDAAGLSRGTWRWEPRAG